MVMSTARRERTCRATGTGGRLTEEERFAEAVQKRKEGDRGDRVEGRNGSLVLGSARLRGHDFRLVVLAAHSSPGTCLSRLIRRSGRCSVLRYIRFSAGAGFQAWRP